jgi:hypothetical protein
VREPSVSFIDQQIVSPDDPQTEEEHVSADAPATPV